MTRTLQQGFVDLSDTGSALLLLAGVAAILSGCSAAHQRESLALPPPAFEPSAEEPALHTVMAAEPALIEPAAGDIMPLPAALPSSNTPCLRFGGGDDAIFYQWGQSRLGVGFDQSKYAGDTQTQAAIRYSFSLQKPSAVSGQRCESADLMDGLRLHF